MRSKPLPVSINTLGDFIQVKRHEKKLLPYHLAVKMGVATGLINSWENGTIQPDIRQLKALANILEFDAADCGYRVGECVAI